MQERTAGSSGEWTVGPTMNCARHPSNATSPTSPPAPSWSPWVGPGCCARRRSTRAGPPWMRGSGKGWVTAEYSMLPGSTARAGRPRGGQGQAVGPHPGDPAPDRAVAAGGHRHGGAWARCRSSLDCDVLQADGGTRTASICGGVRRAARRLHPAQSARMPPGPSADRGVRGGLGRRRRRRAACSTSTTPRTAGPRWT